ncbi:flavin monoamine oxidase family protein [Leptothrix ochracea]|uniref:flavin monoamine oxidase family protein n=1 Tax=Leptothrix ochracea TaxID=735331 RepID=UPI0034E22F80
MHRRTALTQLGVGLGVGLGVAGAPLLGGCRESLPALQALQGGWVGAAVERGHRLRDQLKGRTGTLPAASVQHRTRVLIVGGGVAGLATVRALRAAGMEDLALLELEDSAGGNARGHSMGGIACPLGAHYLPVPSINSPHRAVAEMQSEILALLQEQGLARFELGRWAFEERHLCHSPQERLYIDGAWHEGLLPPVESDSKQGSSTQAAYRRFSALVSQAQRAWGFAVPSLDMPWTAGHAALEAQTFQAWLDSAGLDDERLRWYLDYCCRDDYGAGIDTVSAWAGLHYFASRHGFHAPGDEDQAHEPVFTWPEGNAWLTRRMAQPLGERLHSARTVLSVQEGRHGVELLAWDERAGRMEAWQAEQVVLAVPLFIAARLWQNAPSALQQTAAQARYAPWLVANMHIERPLLQRVGAPPAWDNVAYGGGAGGSTSLGYVDAGHQRLNPTPGPTVLTSYVALSQAERPALLHTDGSFWAQRVIHDLSGLHPDLPAKLQRIDLMRYGHAMRIPLPGTRSAAAHQALPHLPGRIHLAHADLAGYSVFEEAFAAGIGAGRRVATTMAMAMRK